MNRFLPLGYNPFPDEKGTESLNNIATADLSDRRYNPFPDEKGTESADMLVQSVVALELQSIPRRKGD